MVCRRGTEESDVWRVSWFLLTDLDTGALGCPNPHLSLTVVRNRANVYVALSFHFLL